MFALLFAAVACLIAAWPTDSDALIIQIDDLAGGVSVTSDSGKTTVPFKFGEFAVIADPSLPNSGGDPVLLFDAPAGANAGFDLVIPQRGGLLDFFSSDQPSAPLFKACGRADIACVQETGPDLDIAALLYGPGAPSDLQIIVGSDAVPLSEPAGAAIFGAGLLAAGFLLCRRSRQV